MSPEIAFQFEANCERFAVALLIAAGAGDATTVRRRLDSADFATDAEGVELARIAVEASPFVRASGQMCFTAQGIPFYNHFRGQLAFELTTPRAGGSARHHAWIGLVRRLFNDAAVPDFGPYCLLEIEESAGTITFVKDGERDRSSLVYTLQLTIPDRLVDYAETSPVPA